MDTARRTVISAAAGTSARRADAGSVRLGGRDVAGLLLAGDMYGIPYDLLAQFLGVAPARLRGIVARWRRAGYAQTGRLGPGPAWCWLTRSGLAVTGQRYAPARPALARLAHIRAVLAVRLSLQASDAWAQGRAWWRSERRIRAAAGGQVGGGHVPDAEVFWPDEPASGYAGQCWAIEAELTPKPLARTSAIMAGLLARTSDYQPGAAPGPGPRYDRVIYLASPAALGVTARAAAALPAVQRSRLAVRDLPPGAVLVAGADGARRSGPAAGTVSVKPAVVTEGAFLPARRPLSCRPRARQGRSHARVAFAMAQAPPLTVTAPPRNPAPIRRKPPARPFPPQTRKSTPAAPEKARTWVLRNPGRHSARTHSHTISAVHSTEERPVCHEHRPVE